MDINQFLLALRARRKAFALVMAATIITAMRSHWGTTIPGADCVAAPTLFVTTPYGTKGLP